MNRHINLLLQIQELELVLRVNDVIHKNKNTEETGKKLATDIEELKKELPFDIQSNIELLSPKYKVYVVPMVHDCCTGCFLKLPVGIANNVRSPKECISCPNCQRYLYADDLTQMKRPDDNFHYKGLARFSSIELMIPELKSKTHAEAIEEVAKIMAETGYVKDGTKLSEALLEREALCSTSVGSGIAFPHVRGIEACGLVLAVAKAPEGIDFGNGEEVKLLFVSAVPTQTSVFYMDMVSKLVRYFSKAGNMEKLLDCKTPEEMWKIMVKIGR